MTHCKKGSAAAVTLLALALTAASSAAGAPTPWPDLVGPWYDALGQEVLLVERQENARFTGALRKYPVGPDEFLPNPCFYPNEPSVFGTLAKSGRWNAVVRAEEGGRALLLLHGELTDHGGAATTVGGFQFPGGPEGTLLLLKAFTPTPCFLPPPLVGKYAGTLSLPEPCFMPRPVSLEVTQQEGTLFQGTLVSGQGQLRFPLLGTLAALPQPCFMPQPTPVHAIGEAGGVRYLLDGVLAPQPCFQPNPLAFKGTLRAIRPDGTVEEGLIELRPVEVEPPPPAPNPSPSRLPK